MRKTYSISAILLPLGGLLLLGVLLGGCAADRGISKLRAERFPQMKNNEVKVSVQAKALYLKVTPKGNGLTKESIDAANILLTEQGPIRRQVLTIVPLTPAGEKIAPHLASALTAAGARPPLLGGDQVMEENTSKPAKALKNQQQDWDIELTSEAIVVEVPDNTIADPDNWTMSPYYNIGTLGAANRANIAMMVSDPRDLLRPRALAPTEGKIATSALGRYLTDDLKDLIDINFSGDE